MDISAETDRRYGKPEDCNEAEIAMRLGFQAGAKWAREEALKEAVHWAERTYVSDPAESDLQRAWAGGVDAVVRRIRALAEASA